MKYMITIMLTLLAPVAEAKPWETMSVQTQEGDTLTVQKKGRSLYKFLLSSESKGDGIKCSRFFDQMRSSLALNIKVAGTRAQDNEQVGTILSYQNSLKDLANEAMAAYAGVCVLGLAALPGNVVLTFGTLYKMEGRTATLSPEAAIELGAFLQ